MHCRIINWLLLTITECEGRTLSAECDLQAVLCKCSYYHAQIWAQLASLYTYTLSMPEPFVLSV